MQRCRYFSGTEVAGDPCQTAGMQVSVGQPGLHRGVSRQPQSRQRVCQRGTGWKKKSREDAVAGSAPENGPGTLWPAVYKQ